MKISSDCQQNETTLWRLCCWCCPTSRNQKQSPKIDSVFSLRLPKVLFWSILLPGDSIRVKKSVHTLGWWVVYAAAWPIKKTKKLWAGGHQSGREKVMYHSYHSYIWAWECLNHCVYVYYVCDSHPVWTICCMFVKSIFWEYLFLLYNFDFQFVLNKVFVLCEYLFFILNWYFQCTKSIVSNSLVVCWALTWMANN